MYARTSATEKIINLDKRIRIIQGGTAAGKTIGILQVLIDYAQSDEVPTLTSIVSESFPHLKRGVIRDFLNILQEHNYFKDARWNKTDYVYTFESGSKIEFFSADQPGKVRGPRRDRLFLNEANNISFDIYEQLEVRTKELVFIDYNPVADFWAFQLLKQPNTDHLILTYLDNEALDPAIIQSIEARKERKGWWKVYGEGQLGEVEGKIYNSWQIIDEIPHEARLERYGLDFGYTNDPTALIALYYYNGGYVVDEILYQNGLMNKQIASVIANQRPALVIADSAEPKSIDEIRSFGINILPTDKGKDSIKHGINLVQGERISVTKQSVNIIKEYRNYLWMVDKNGIVLNQPEGGFDHAMDAIRYAMTSLVPIKRKDEFIASLPLPRHYRGQKAINPAK